MTVKWLSVLGLVLYVVLSAVDFSLTFTLIERSAGEVIEANPVAAVWLERYGWPGLAAYKTAIVLVFLGAVGLLVPRRPWTAAGLAAVGCAALIGVTTHSHRMVEAAAFDQPIVLEIPAPTRAELERYAR